MAHVTLGNTAPIDTHRPDPSVDTYERIPLDIGNSETAYHIPDDVDLYEALKTILDTYGAYHSNQPPAWVESDDSGLATAVSRQFKCPIGRPEGWNEQG